MATRKNKSRQPANSMNEPSLTPMQRSLLDEAGRKVTIVADGKQSEVSVGQVVSRKLLQMAANGSVHAMSNAFNEMVQAERLKQREIAEKVEFGRWYKEHQQKLLDQAIETGLDPETVLPHPDDILVVAGEGYRIIGPDDPFTLNLMKENCARRDVFILQHVLEMRLQPTNSPASRNGIVEGDDAIPHSSALLMVYFMNHGLPERFKLSDLDIERAISRHQRMTKRQLLKEAHRAWAAIGRPRPRGWMLPPFPEVHARLEYCVPALRDLYTQLFSDKGLSDHAFVEQFRRIIQQAP